MFYEKGQTALEYLLIIAGAIAIAAIAVFVAMGSLESSGSAVQEGADVSASCQKACLHSSCSDLDACFTDCISVCPSGVKSPGLCVTTTTNGPDGLPGTADDVTTTNFDNTAVDHDNDTATPSIAVTCGVQATA